MPEKNCDSYRYSVGVNLRDSNQHILSQNYYFFNSLKHLYAFISICEKLKWEVFNIRQELDL